MSRRIARMAPRPPRRTRYRPDRKTFSVSAPIYAAMEQVAKARGVSVAAIATEMVERYCPEGS